MDLDPIEYGKLIATVAALEKKIDKIESSLESLLELANKGRGGFWAGMMMASFAGAAISYLSKYLPNH